MRRANRWTAVAAAATLALGAALAVPPASQAAGKSLPGIAVGADEDGNEMRLVGSKLTVALAKPLAPGRRRVRVTATCGDLVRTEDEVVEDTYGVSATARARVRGSARRIVVRLDRGVAAQATSCSLKSDASPTGGLYLRLEMRHVRGRGACRRGPVDRVLGRSDAVVLVRTDVDNSDNFTSDQPVVVRACRSATGRFEEIATYGVFAGGRSGVIWLGPGVVTGERVAWSVAVNEGHGWQPMGLESGLWIMSADLAADPASVTSTFAVAVDGRVETALLGPMVLSPAGSVAWVARVSPDRLQARGLDGVVQTLDTGVIADPAISPDGTTLTWLNAGVQRSAPLP